MCKECKCPEDKEIIYCGCKCHNEESLWENNTIQFARLINELDLIGSFTPDILRELANVTDLSQTEILDLIERAKNVYDNTLETL